MTHDPERVAECSGWLDRARADLEAAEILLTAPRPHPDIALFHCQQTVEKAWKALLCWHGVIFRKTHDLRELGRASARADASLRSLARRAEDLTPFAWVFRYPGEPEEPDLGEAGEVLECAREVYTSVRDRFPIEGRT